MGILPQTSAAAAAAAGTSSPNGGVIPAQPSSVAAGAQTTIAPAGGSVQQSGNPVPNNSGAAAASGGSDGIVTMGCPNNGNSFPTGAMGSCGMSHPPLYYYYTSFPEMRGIEFAGSMLTEKISNGRHYHHDDLLFLGG